jgi:hypothetical protein
MRAHSNHLGLLLELVLGQQLNLQHIHPSNIWIMFRSSLRGNTILDLQKTCQFDHYKVNDGFQGAQLWDVVGWGGGKVHIWCVLQPMGG